MNWYSLEKVWRAAGRKNQIKVRFNDWTHQIKYFTIIGESSDGKRFIGTLDSGEKMSFSKRSRGWTLYYPESEFQAHAV
jgi:ATP-dependent DNA ligase